MEAEELSFYPTPHFRSQRALAIRVEYGSALLSVYLSLVFGKRSEEETNAFSCPWPVTGVKCLYIR